MPDEKIDTAEKVEIMKAAVITYPGFPKPGINFRGTFGLFNDVAALQAMKELLLDHVSQLDVDLVVGLDSKGFLIGPLISLQLGVPFVPIRKKGKLPGKVVQASYTLEYGDDIMELQVCDYPGKNKVLLVDDFLATGGTLVAAEKLIKLVGMTVVECLVIMELTTLNARSKIEAPVHSLVQWHS